MNASDKTRRPLIEEMRVLRSRNAKLERVYREIRGFGDIHRRVHTDGARFQSLVQTVPSVIVYLHSGLLHAVFL